MVFDLNTYIGHWPFRQIRHNTAESLAGYLTAGGIDRACVSSVNAIFYKDCMEGNRELLRQITSHDKKFVPFGIINPAYTNWKTDFQECIESLEIKGLELYPYYHDYNLTDRNSMELIGIAIEAGIPVHLPCAVVNIRQRHWMDTMENLKINEVKKILSEFRNGNFIISNGASNEISRELSGITVKRKGRVLYDFARLEVFSGALDELIETTGIENIVYGSVAPFQYIEPQSVKLKYLNLPKEDKKKIEHINLEDLLCL